GQVFKPWLFRIARNLKNTHFTKKREFSDDFKVVETFNDSEKIIDELIIEKEKLQQLHQALDELPEKTKEILVLFKFQRIPYKELANILNCSESAAKVRVHRAIKQLRKAYFKIEYR
ncbi:MAG: RNA polymerase sigma factor, partial [Saprospiraceae bacterium]